MMSEENRHKTVLSSDHNLIFELPTGLDCLLKGLSILSFNNRILYTGIEWTFYLRKSKEISTVQRNWSFKADYQKLKVL
jgi:hypothetical protein